MNELEKAEQKIEELQQQLKVANEEYEHLLTQHERLPFKQGETCWLLLNDSDYEEIEWDKEYHTHFFQGNVFKTEHEAEVEGTKRALITTVKLFRDECNSKVKDNKGRCNKYMIVCKKTGNVKHCVCREIRRNNYLSPFGLFETRADCQRAIDLFGKDIVNLWGTDL
nr:MAG TPA: hypothetical protein [Caudoviricetes sp.]